MLTLTSSETADIIMDDIKQNTEFKSEVHIICFTLPVTKTVGLSQSLVQASDVNG